MKHIPIQLSTLRSKAFKWYERPIHINIRLSFSKSTFIILILILLLILTNLPKAGASSINKIANPPVGQTTSKVPKALTGGFSISDDMFIQAIAQRDARIAHQKAIERARIVAKQRAAIKTAQVAASRSSFGMGASATPVYHNYGGGCNDAKSCIYWHESHNNPAAVNPSGCFGLGQDCNGIVRSRCGVSYGCQDAYFTQYAISRYGSWANAWSAWQSKGWW